VFCHYFVYYLNNKIITLEAFSVENQAVDRRPTMRLINNYRCKIENYNILPNAA